MAALRQMDWENVPKMFPSRNFTILPYSFTLFCTKLAIFSQGVGNRVQLAINKFFIDRHPVSVDEY